MLDNILKYMDFLAFKECPMVKHTYFFSNEYHKLFYCQLLLSR